MEELILESSHRVPVTKIKEVMVHPNAERLSIYKVYDFNVVAGLNQYQIGDTVIYIPIDSILPEKVESKLFGPDSKVKLHKSRVKQIRLRGAVSQGMIVSPITLGLKGNLEENQDVGEKLGILKYEPPIPNYAATNYKGPRSRNKPKENPYFHTYGGVQNFKYYTEFFQEGQEIVIQEKIHGTNFRAGILPYIPTTLWEKIKSKLGLLPKFQFCYGSNNVQLQKRPGNKGYYGENIYQQIAEKYDIANKLEPNETIYGEIYGPGIQKGYDYGQTELKLVIFDVKKLAEDRKSTQWMTVDEVKDFCSDRLLANTVPELYRGPYSKETVDTYTKGPSILGWGKQEIREGIVIRDPKETSCYMGKKVVKYLNEDYLDLDNTDFH